jgi:hypothetical protein
MNSLKPPSTYTKPCTSNGVKVTCLGLNGSASQWTFSQLPTFRSRFCLQSQAGFIRNMNDPKLLVDDNFNVFTSNPNEAQQYVDQDVAAAKLRAIADQFPDLTLTEVNYVSREGKWFAVC